MIVAFAGRRIDAPDAATPCFPLTQVAVVRDQLERLFCQGMAILVDHATLRGILQRTPAHAVWS
ncbi:MAG: hypothetical protein WD425_08165 [Nitrospirales bacterium]